MRLSISAIGLCTALVAAPVFAQEAEVIHWWTSQGESRAVKELANAFNGAGGVWVDNAIAGGSAARQAAITRIVAGDPPQANQLNTGREFEDLVEQNLLVDISEVADAGNWASTMPAALLEGSKRDGKVYAMPINIHGRNWIWYNTSLLAEVGATPPMGWGEDMFEALDKVKKAGKVPLALSGTPNYEMSLFETILLDIGGTELWIELLQDTSDEAFQSAELRKAFETYARLRDYVDEGSPGRKWNQAVNMVITGEAAFTTQGDWAKG
ncbi:MAG: ABC transporter substrate-binding protein, partial [Rhodospirillales bacterium]|nr:ABC transporter substrate-binding protein [Rhodospirillales bacterium]